MRPIPSSICSRSILLPSFGILALLYAAACSGADEDPPPTAADEAPVSSSSSPLSILFFPSDWNAAWTPIDTATNGTDPVLVRGTNRLDLLYCQAGRLYWRRSADGYTWPAAQDVGEGRDCANVAATTMGDWLMVVMTTPGGDIHVRTHNGASWLYWERLTGLTNAPPVAVTSGNYAYVFVRGTDNRLYSDRTFGTLPGGWTGFSPVGPWLTIDGRPAVTASGFGDLHVAVRELPTNQVRYQRFNAGTWLPTWWDLGVQTLATPALASTAPGHLEMVVTGLDKGLLHSRYAGTWSSFQYIPGVADSSPARGFAAARPALVGRAGGVDYFIQGTDHALYWYRFNGTSWGTSRRLANCMSYANVVPAVAVSESRMDLVALGADRMLYHNLYDVLSSSDPGPAPPACICGSANEICCGGDTCPGGSSLSCQGGTCQLPPPPLPPPPPPPPPPPLPPECFQTTSMCGLYCPAGFHPISYNCNYDCGSCDSIWVNRVTCQKDCAIPFSQCGATCPAGYATVRAYCNSVDCGQSCPSGYNNAADCVKL